MIGNIRITITDQPGILSPGQTVVMYAPGDPVPTGLQITEVVTAGRHRLSTGEDPYYLNRVVQKIAYNRYKLKVFARPSDNAALLNSGRWIAVQLPDGTIHKGEILEFDDKAAAPINARMIDIVYIDTNPDNYSKEPVNNYLSSQSLATRVTQGSVSAAKLIRLVAVVPTVSSTVFYTALQPVADLSEVNRPEEDQIAGLMRSNITNAQNLFSCTFYLSEADRTSLHSAITLNGGVSGNVQRLIIGTTVHVAVEVPTFEIEPVSEGADLFLCTLTFKYSNNYIYNY